MNILDDNCQVLSLLDGDHITFTYDGETEILENITLTGDSVVGFSHITGDTESYELDPTMIVSTWEA